ncbi:hypothetical protein [Microcoleus sp. PH2017_05_CCC_O_A]|uniref:hypothetical protein n=1 Tax=Microcoleus sp. PH2017_05_CCC_O_A TaxID=2798816 RepID=UPI001D61C5ED|nr:hypothetical protein [Microcoleus sp. PH2017_05_CCC_O_A]MCC3439367.1 hypothetical protein [Microcoleus sp. PH2017_05_CCC_O_A]
MARPEGITFRGNNYLPDWGTATQTFNYKYTFKIPDGTTDAMINAIIAAVGGTVINTRGVPCEDEEGYSWSPRKLKFWFEAGKTVSIPVPSKTNLVAASATIAGQLNQIARVICVSLEGETWRNIIDLLDPTSSVLPPVPLPITDTDAGEKETSYVGTMNYETDGSFEMASKAFKMATNLAGNIPYAQYATAINNCLTASGGPINTSSARCPGFRQVTFEHRRFRVVMLQNRRVVEKADGATPGAASEIKAAKSEMLVPMSSRDPELIRACGLALRAVPHTMCLGYRGEWDKRFSSKNPTALPTATP